MAEDFTDSQAIDAIRKMAFEYKVFSRAEAVLQRLVDAGKRIEELNVQRETLLNEIKQLEEAKDTAEFARQKIYKGVADARAEADEKLAAIRKEQQDIDEQKRQIHEDFAEFKKKNDEQITEHNDRIRSANERLLQAESALARFKSHHGL